MIFKYFPKTELFSTKVIIFTIIWKKRERTQNAHSLSTDWRFSKRTLQNSYKNSFDKKHLFDVERIFPHSVRVLNVKFCIRNFKVFLIWLIRFMMSLLILRKVHVTLLTYTAVQILSGILRKSYLRSSISSLLSKWSRLDTSFHHLFKHRPPEKHCLTASQSKSEKIFRETSKIDDIVLKSLCINTPNSHIQFLF